MLNMSMKSVLKSIEKSNKNFPKKRIANFQEVVKYVRST